VIPRRCSFALLLFALPAFSQEVTSHPRLFFRAADVSRLRSWAVASNPIYQDGLAVLAQRAKADMDAGNVPGDDARNGGTTYVDYSAEAYAELFAFLSQVSPDATARDDYARRARTLLMYVITRAAQGAAAGQPYRDPAFSISDRSRWHGEGFGLTVDWIYSSLTVDDKAAIRQVFLRWIGENLNAAITGHDHPVPVGVVNDPVLVADREAVRWSLNNYYASHMRNIGLMSLAFDAADDPGGTLRAYVSNAAGAWLYVQDHALRTEAQGGLVPEGFEYGPQTLAYTMQFLLALETAGLADTSRFGPQVSIAGNPFWDDSVSATFHSMSPRPVVSPSLGVPVYQPAWYGDGLAYRAPDFIPLFGAMGLHDVLASNASRLAALRWFERNVPPGGPDGLAARVADPSGFFQDSIFAFLLFDPAATPPADPRPALPLTHYAPGLNRLLVRTDWSADASWLSYKLSFNLVDHQYGDGNQFELYRKGEWLTKERTGYDLEFGGPQNHNTLGLQNDPPEHNDACEYRNIDWLQGAQWAYSTAGDPALLARSVTPGHVYVLGDATNLYNSTYERSLDIVHASRSLVWLPPDHVVVYDRAVSKTAGRFKRFWLSFAGNATTAGRLTTVTTPSGQKLFVTTLLPLDAAVASEPASILQCNGNPAGSSSAAEDDPITSRLRVEAPGGPASVRFLNVLEGADAGASPDPAALVTEVSSGWTGAVVHGTALLFPVDLGVPFTSLNYRVPPGTTSHLITGLTPGAAFSVTQETVGADTRVTIVAGGASGADAGGLLAIGGPAPGVSANLTVPIVLSSSGLSGAFFTSELALTNRGVTDASISYAYTAAFGGTNGAATDSLPAGRQKVIPDAIAYLRGLGIPLGDAGNRGGTLRVTFSGLSSSDAGAATVRTTTSVPEGRAGLAYAGLPTSRLLSAPVYICGLRQNATDRSNVAVLNAGGPTDGAVTLRLTVVSGDPANPMTQALPDVTLPPGGFSQVSGVLASNGLALTNGYVRIERVSGAAPFTAYGVINDQANSDGSFVEPVLANPTSAVTGLTLPVLVETSAFSSELVLANLTSSARAVRFTYVTSALPGGSVGFDVPLLPNEQQILSNFVQLLRDRGVIAAAPGPTFAGALFATDAAGDLRGIAIGARTSSPGGGGRYGLYYSAVPAGAEATTSAWLYGLQQNAENRTNLALVNVGSTDGSTDVFRIDLYDGGTGQKSGTVDSVSVPARGFVQINAVLAQYAPGVANGYAQVTRTSGANPFIAYAVINDGSQAGQRSGDGAFVSASLPAAP
jgi:hypothetical protein